MSRFWSSFWTVAGFLFLIGLFQMIADNVLTLFRIVEWLSPTADWWIRTVSQAVLPIWAALTFIDWRWGWKPDNAGLRGSPAARFWLLPGLLGGVLAAGVGYLLDGVADGSVLLPTLYLDPVTLAETMLAAVAAFTTELIFRGVVISRFQYDLSGGNLLTLAVGMPLVWMLAQSVIGPLVFLYSVPSPDISGLGTLALSVFLSLLFLRYDSVWLAAGVRAGLAVADPLGLSASESALLPVFGIPAGILLFLELQRMRTIRRPGPRRGPQRVTHGKTVRGPWGPH